MTKSELCMEPPATWSLQSAGRLEGSLGTSYDLGSQVDDAS